VMADDIRVSQSDRRLLHFIAYGPASRWASSQPHEHLTVAVRLNLLMTNQVGDGN
jgi:hypothetical protein